LLGESEIVGGLQPGQRFLVSFPHTVTDLGITDITTQIESVNPSIESNAGNNTAHTRLGTLSPPTGLVAQADGQTGNLVVRWDTPDPKGGLLFDVFRADQAAGPFELVGTTAGLEFADPLTRPGPSYFYRVVARDEAGIASPPSEIVQERLDVQVRIRRADQGLLIAWPRRFTGFQLQEAPEVSGPWTPVTAASAAVGFEQQTSLPAVQGRRFYRVAD
jgi:hypothetical protein